jgi:pimeloyl-ACP methyl ester carboxylesterase
MKLTQKIAVACLRNKFRLLTLVSKKKTAEKAFELFCTPQRRTKKQTPKSFEDAEKLTLILNNIPVRGYRWNHPAKPKALILHGFESSVINFDCFVHPLIKKGYEVLAFDAPAHGSSGGERINAPLYRDMILAIHEKYGPVESFLAHSFGGLALSLALETMDHNQNYKAVMIAPATETTTAIQQFFHLLQITNKEVKAEFEKQITVAGGHPSSWYSIKRAFKNIKAFFLWIHDEDDTITPIKDIRQLMDENRPTIRFVITKGLGHRRIYQDKDVIKTILDFL